MNFERSESIQNLTAALVAAQSVIHGAAKTSENPHLRSKYADLASVWEACRGPLTANGLAVMQPASASGATITVTTILAHVSGEWISSDLTLTSDKNTPQGLGSCLTYARRYGLSAMVGIAPEDDDANETSGTKAAKFKEGQDAAREVVTRKLAAASAPVPEPPAAGPQAVPKDASKNFQALQAFGEAKKIIGEKLYYATLEVFGYKKSNEITDTEKAREVYKALAVIVKVFKAAEHGELPANVSEPVFNELPDKSRAACFVEIRKKLSVLLGSSDTATDIYEDHRAESRSQWDHFTRLQKAIDHYSAKAG